MTTNKRCTLFIALFLLTACAPVTQTQPTAPFSPTAPILSTTAPTHPPVFTTTENSDAVDHKLAGNYLDLHVIYFFVYDSSGIEFSITHVDSMTTYLPNIQISQDIQTSQEMLPLTVLFKNAAGRVLLKQPLPIVRYTDQLAIDIGLVVEWAIVIPNDPQYECVALETPYQFPQMKFAIEPPLRVCMSEQ